MSERNLRRRTPTSGGGRRIRPPHPSSSSSKLASPSTPRRSGKHYSKPTMVFRRSFSEPMLCGGGRSEGEDHLSRRSLWSGSESEGGVLYRPKTCTDVMVSSTSLTNLCPKSPSFEVFNKEAKVVVNVTVEGSPGPLMIMVKLGCSVEDTIKLVLDKYGKEGRTPKLDKDAASTYELHHSYFCLQGLDKSELLGDLGTRSFFLRRRRNNGASTSCSSEVDPAKGSPPPGSPPAFLFPCFCARKISKLVRRTRRLWKILICWQ
ncbi:hypothetical protein K2173_018238 [Erythroxylum novogranatense]|uniref:DUF7054 domain-containing protein n=1 Tax=Erythroxylum novogranatense TaxID=1862640 RepID=A0AAV8TLC1_9ROSI|nr:hypothetical protein K2173_018238 [Erythroxylum novogranatense]